jgi:hypothetical protein
MLALVKFGETILSCCNLGIDAPFHRVKSSVNQS